MKRLLKNQNKGFSLIEVAIAVVVIGFVVGVTLKGRELIRTAKINSVIEQVNSFKIAIQMFVDKYGSIPGDLNNASEIFGENVSNGNNAGTIDTNDDAKRFWQHLLAADFFTAELVNGFPVSKMGGYYTVASHINGLDGIWVVLNLTPDNKTFTAELSEEEAYSIDKKNDTGNPSTGEIRTFHVEGGQLRPIGGKYDLRKANRNCVMMFRIW